MAMDTGSSGDGANDSIRPLSAQEVQLINRLVRFEDRSMVDQAKRLIRRHGATDPTLDPQDAVNSALLGLIEDLEKGRMHPLECPADFVKGFRLKLKQHVLREVVHRSMIRSGGAGFCRAVCNGGAATTADDSAGPARGFHRNTMDVDLLPSRQPPLDLSVLAQLEIDELIDQLGATLLRVIAKEALDGFTNQEIAQRHGVSTRTVARKLATIRQMICDLGFPL